MFVPLAAALSLTASLALDVPYLPQTEGLCGAAAAAMVFRYWGDVHADLQPFATLVDRRAGGIAGGVLVDAIGARGWQTVRFEGSLDHLDRRLARGQPAIVLLGTRRDRYHYVVVVGTTDHDVVVHDPSWGPSRRIARDEFERRWRASNFWTLVILPGENRVASPSLRKDELVLRQARDEGLCDGAVQDALRGASLEAIESRLRGLRAECPSSAAPLGELAGVRFAQKRYADATALARQALEKSGDDEYALDVLGASLFMRDKPADALRAWNRLGKPRVDLLHIEAGASVRQQSIAEAAGILPNMLLTADAFDRARHRLEDLPAGAAARLTVRPERDGFATVDLVVTPRESAPHGAVEWTAASVRAAVTREATVDLPSLGGDGAAWSAAWRWWTDRPAIGVAFAAPGFARAGGIWRVDAGWERETFAFGAAAPTQTNTRVHGGISVSDWISGRVKFSVAGGVDAWTGDARTASLGGSLERRWLDDRLTAVVGGERAVGLVSAAGYHTVAARSSWRSTTTTGAWSVRADAGIRSVGADAPLMLWPRASETTTPLLRAHPLLDGGIVNVNGGAVFGRTVTYATAEAQRWLDRPILPRVAAAAFIDAGRAARTAPGTTPRSQVDIGGGLRIRVPGAPGLLRVDAARGLLDGGEAVTVGWQF